MPTPAQVPEPLCIPALGPALSSGDIPLTSGSCRWHDPTDYRTGIRGERRLAFPPSLKLVPLLLLPVAWSAFCKASQGAAGVARKPRGYPGASVSRPGASVSPPGKHCLYRSTEALDVPLLPHPE